MSEKVTDKLKEQCLEAILSVVPTGQIIFVLLMAILLFRIDHASVSSPLLALKDVGIKDLVGFEKGQFWVIGALYIISSFFLALLNDSIFRAGLRRSYSVSNVASRIDGWMQRSLDALKGADKDLRTSIRESISKELDKRIARYRSKRLVCEMLVSLGLAIGYASVYLVLRNFHGESHIGFSNVDALVAAFCLMVGWGYHLASVKYAIRKIIPLQVYLSASTGELAFFIDVD
ncbi:hypothetical protein KDW69_28255 [Burkholderia ambifaria]|uniref:hypothetical protein n=1 Tax=Burkholderia ambifaria TaxID=152480 RepID=UPI001B8DFC01|nr:hypothetical protein [Burkholderia ambifaria]MBR8335546.1 hypothetical protein [Burkholderia ambifaria]